LGAAYKPRLSIRTPRWFCAKLYRSNPFFKRLQQRPEKLMKALNPRERRDHGEKLAPQS